jgi:hypothetical protein
VGEGAFCLFAFEAMMAAAAVIGLADMVRSCLGEWFCSTFLWFSVLARSMLRCSAGVYMYAYRGSGGGATTQPDRLRRTLQSKTLQHNAAHMYHWWVSAKRERRGVLAPWNNWPHS